MRKTILTLAFATCTTAATYAQTTSATTDAVGYNTVTCLPNSDTIVSVPFLNTSDSISSTVSGSLSLSGNNATFTINGVTNLTADQYKDLYYVRFTSGNMDGNIYKITGNTTSAVTFDTQGDPVTAANGDKFTIYKFWTLGTLFPVADQVAPNGTIVQSSGNLGFQRRTEILLPNNTGNGINRAPSKSFFLTSTGWKNSVDSTVADNTLLPPDSYFIIRHPAAVTQSTTFRPVGTVDALTQMIVPLFTNTSGYQDNQVAIPRPVNVELTKLNLLEGNAFVSSSNNLGFNRRDELLVFSNSTAIINRAPSATYFHNGTNWINSSTLAISDSIEILPSQGIIIRKYQTANGATSFWKNTPSY